MHSGINNEYLDVRLSCSHPKMKWVPFASLFYESHRVVVLLPRRFFVSVLRVELVHLVSFLALQPVK